MCVWPLHNGQCNTQSLKLIYVGQCLRTDRPSSPLPATCTSQKQFQVFQVRPCVPGLRAVASAEHTSPFCVRTETEHLRIRVNFAVENVCKSSKTPSTDAEHVCTVEPSIAPELPQNLLNNPMISTPHATPRHRTRDCQIRGQMK